MCMAAHTDSKRTLASDPLEIHVGPRTGRVLGTESGSPAGPLSIVPPKSFEPRKLLTNGVLIPNLLWNVMVTLFLWPVL